MGRFALKQMIGKNAVELNLPPAYSRLHPIFNVSLLMPFVGFDEIIPDFSFSSHNDFPQNFVDWASMTFVVDYCCLYPRLHKYLIRGNDASNLNDEWRLLTTIPPNIDPFLQHFHHSTPTYAAGPSQEVWEQRARTLV